MKIRTGFVSNSSSSSFICYIPEKWNPTDEEILNAAEDRFDDVSEEVIIGNIRNAINDIKLGKEIGEYDNYPVFCTLGDLIPDKFVQSSQDVPSDCGCISGISLEKIYNIVKEYV